MPLYEFHCTNCGRDSEILVRSSKTRGASCPACGSVELKKKLSTFASGGMSGESAPACSGVPTSCGRCGTGKPHSH